MKRCINVILLLCLLVAVAICGKKEKAQSEPNGSKTYGLTAGGIAIDAGALEGQWERQTCAELDDIDDPPSFPDDDEDAQFAKEMFTTALPQFKAKGVKSLANYLYTKHVQGESETYDINIMVFKDVDCCTKMWAEKFPAEARKGMVALTGVGEEGCSKKGQYITYTFARRANVYISVKALMGGTSGIELATAIDGRLCERIGSGG